MKRLLLVVAVMSLSTTLFAKEIKIASEKLGYDEELVDAKFVINAEMGRAWVEYDIMEDDGEDEWYKEKRVKVTGLSFDKTTGNIVYKDTDTSVVCVTTTIRTRRITGTIVRILTNTGACYFDYRREYEIVDDGFELKRKLRDTLYLIVN